MWSCSWCAINSPVAWAYYHILSLSFWDDVQAVVVITDSPLLLLLWFLYSPGYKKIAIARLSGVTQASSLQIKTRQHTGKSRVVCPSRRKVFCWCWKKNGKLLTWKTSWSLEHCTKPGDGVAETDFSVPHTLLPPLISYHWGTLIALIDLFAVRCLAALYCQWLALQWRMWLQEQLYLHQSTCRATGASHITKVIVKRTILFLLWTNCTSPWNKKMHCTMPMQIFKEWCKTGAVLKQPVESTLDPSPAMGCCLGVWGKNKKNTRSMGVSVPSCTDSPM